MAAYEFTGAKWNSTTLGAPGGQVTWSFAALAGNFYSFDAPIAQAVYQNLIRDAFQAWENVANIDFVEVPASAAPRSIWVGTPSMGPSVQWARRSTITIQAARSVN
jgi:hypothetical protein